MPQTALSSSNLQTIRGTSTVASRFVQRLRVSMNPNTNAYTARVNQTVFANSFTQITYDGGSGTLANVVIGMRIVLSHTNDKSNYYWSGRINATPTSSIFYIGETSISVTDNDYIFIILDFMIADKLAKEVSGVQQNDGHITFRQLLPVIYNLKSVYAGDINSGTNLFTQSFAPLAYAGTSSATISSWLWTIDSGTTITVGSTTTQNITCTLTEGHHYIHVRVTDSGGRTLTRHIEIHAHGITYTYQLMSVENVQLTRNVGTGDDANLTNYVAPTGLLDLTQITMWSDDTYQTGDAALTGDNILFIGRIRARENQTAANEQYGLDKNAGYTVEGALTQLARTEQLPYEMLNTASPTKFGHITNMSLWRGIVYLLSEYSTFLELHSLTFDSSDNTYLAPTRNPSGDILAAVNDLAFSINAALQIGPSGQAEVVRHACMLESGRSSLITRADLITADLLSFTLKQDGARPVGLLKAFGGSYNSTTNLYTTAEGHAPGLAPESGSQILTLDRQVLAANLSYTAAKAASVTRAKNGLEKAQEVDKLEATFTPSWYSALIPSLNTWYTFTLDSTMTVDGAVITKTVLTSATRWLLIEAQLGLNAKGIPEVKGSFIRETEGITIGFGVDYPPPSSPTIPSYPSSPSVPMFPVPPIYLPPTPGGDEIPVPVTINLPLDGNAWIVGGEETGEQSLKLTTTMLQLANPYTRQIIPSDFGADEVIKDWKCNPFGDKRGGYLLSYDTVLLASRVWYTADFTAYPVVWTAGEIIEGEYTELRIVYDGDGKVIVGGANVTPTGCADRWEVGTGTETARTTDSITASSVSFGGNQRIIINVIGTRNGPAPSNADCRLITRVINSGSMDGTSGWFLPSASYPGDEQLGLFSATYCVWWLDSGSSVPFTATFTFATDMSCGDCTGTTAATSNYSDDRGATWSGAEPIDTVGSWIDTEKGGTVTLAGGDGQTRTSDSGGLWSDYGSAKASSAGFLPRYLLPPGLLSNNGANPQSVIFAAALDTGASMWMSKSSNSAFTDITPVSGGIKGLSTGPRCINGHWLNSSIIYAIANFSGTLKLCVTTNGGTTWYFTSALNADAIEPVSLRGDATQKLLGWANGSKVAIMKNLKATSLTFVEKELGFSAISCLDCVG